MTLSEHYQQVPENLKKLNEPAAQKVLRELTELSLTNFYDAHGNDFVA